MEQHTWVAAPERRAIGIAGTLVAVCVITTIRLGPVGVVGTAISLVLVAIAAVHMRRETGKHRNDRVRIGEDALEIEREGASRSVPWSAITALVAVRAAEHPGIGRHVFWGRSSLDGEVAPRWSYRVRTRSEEVLVIDDHWTDFERLSVQVDERVRALLVPKMRAALRAGERCSFGALELSNDGVHFEDRTLAWKDLHRIRSEQGLVVVERKPVGRFAIPDVRTVENVSTLMAIAEWAPKTLAKETYRSQA